MRLKSLLWGVFSILVITSCSEKKESPTEEVKTSVEFLEEKYTIVAGAEATVSLKIEPLVKAMSAEFSVADESIVTITDKELEDDGLSIRLKLRPSVLPPLWQWSMVSLRRAAWKCFLSRLSA